jgi:hypothetical protein
MEGKRWRLFWITNSWQVFMGFCFFFFYEIQLIDIFSSPGPKVRGELIVSKGDAQGSVVRRHSSTYILFSVSAGQIHFRFGLYHNWGSHTSICSYHYHLVHFKVKRAINSTKTLKSSFTELIDGCSTNFVCNVLW